jgi:hypothetical protein
MLLGGVLGRAILGLLLLLLFLVAVGLVGALEAQVLGSTEELDVGCVQVSRTSQTELALESGVTDLLLEDAQEVLVVGGEA